MRRGIFSVLQLQGDEDGNSTFFTNAIDHLAKWVQQGDFPVLFAWSKADLWTNTCILQPLKVIPDSAWLLKSNFSMNMWAYIKADIFDNNVSWTNWTQKGVTNAINFLLDEAMKLSLGDGLEFLIWVGIFI